MIDIRDDKGKTLLWGLGPIVFIELSRPPLNLKEYIRNVPNFPKPGILFRDITPLLSAPKAFKYAIERFAEHFRPAEPTAILAAESRGFIFGAPLALELGVSFVPIRKPGKLPFETHRYEYDLEYGTDALEMHIDALPSGSRVLLLDDLLATGGTIGACKRLAESCQANVIGCGFLVELTFLNGRQMLPGCEVFSLIQYDGEN